MPSASSPCPWLRGICFGKRELVPPLSTVVSVTMTQIVSTLASLLQGAWHPGHTQSALLCAVTTPLTNDMFPLDLLQELLAPRPGHHGGIFNCVRLAAGGQQEAASTKLVSPAPSFSLCCCLCTK